MAAGRQEEKSWRQMGGIERYREDYILVHNVHATLQYFRLNSSRCHSEMVNFPVRLKIGAEGSKVEGINSKVLSHLLTVG